MIDEIQRYWNTRIHDLEMTDEPVGTLGFFGLGVQPPQPSWGLMINENYNFIITHNPFLALIPGFAIMILVLAFNLLGNGLRDAVEEG